MAHGREQIRDAFVTQCTGLTTTGTNVFGSRVFPTDDAVLPCLVIYSLEEEVIDGGRTLGHRIERKLKMLVQGRAKKAADLDDTLDDIAAEVEVAIADDITLGALCRCVELERTEITLSAEEEKPIGTVDMEWAAYYSTAASDAETILPAP